MIWWNVIIMIVSAVLSYALAPKPPTPKPPALEDFDAPTAEDGRAIMMIFGDVYVDDPNLISYGDLRTVPIKAKGGKK